MRCSVAVNLVVCHTKKLSNVVGLKTFCNSCLLFLFQCQWLFFVLAVHFNLIQDSFQTWSSSSCVTTRAFAVLHHVLQPLLCLLWASDVNSYGCFVCIGWSSQKFLGWKCFHFCYHMWFHFHLAVSLVVVCWDLPMLLVHLAGLVDQ